MLSNTTKATLIGFTAIIFWSSGVGFARLASDGFGSCLAPAINYSVAALCILIYNLNNSMKKCKKENISYNMGNEIKLFFKNVPLSYIIICGGLFIIYNFAFVLSIGVSTSNRQVLEVGLINYLWPSLIIIFSVLFFKEKVKKLVYLGVIISFLGIAYSTTDGSLDYIVFWQNMIESPLPYFLVLFSAIGWALYSNLLHYWQSHNCLFIFFGLVALIFWISAFLLGQINEVSFSQFPYIAFISAVTLGMANAISYFTWEIGITKGNMTILAVASYFIPILSSLFTALCFLEMPDISFFYGVILVVIGSIISWYATLEKK